jgi:hypothetical protein
MHSITYDPIHDEFTVPQEFGQAILTYHGGANGEEPPIRVIQGPLTRLRAPDKAFVDPVNNEIFVPEGYAILVFSRTAVGNVAPIRILYGPEGTSFNAQSVAIDTVHNVIVVSGSAGPGQPRLFIFDRTAEGHAAPRATIGGPKSMIISGGDPYVYPPKNEILMSVHRGDVASEESYVGVWSLNDNGDVPPKWTIGGPNGALRQPRAIALDPKHKTMMISDKYLNGVLTYYFPEIF